MGTHIKGLVGLLDVDLFASPINQNASLSGQVPASMSALGRCLRSGLKRVQLPAAFFIFSSPNAILRVINSGSIAQRSPYSSESSNGILFSLPISTRHQARGHVGRATESSGIMGNCVPTRYGGWIVFLF